MKNTHAVVLLAKVKQGISEDEYLHRSGIARLIEDADCARVIQTLHDMSGENGRAYTVPLGGRWRNHREIAASKLLREIQPELGTWLLSQAV